MKKLSTLIVCVLLSSLAAMAQTLAFPTAEGYGKYASGGRGGEVVEVTNLLDDPNNPPEGSFRWAIQQHPGKPITIVFRVSGTIDLKNNPFKHKRSNMTIAGQTAPGDGICIKGGFVNLGGSENVIIRHIRSRVGVDAADTIYRPGYVSDSDFIPGAALGIENGGNFIIDHCSFSWSAEETMNIYDNHHTTVQWCIISEALYSAGHNKGSDRAFGAVWGGRSASYHHNLLAHNKSRNPRFGNITENDTVMHLDIVNNVMYNWGNYNACYGGNNKLGTGGRPEINLVNNYYKPGPARPGNNSSYFACASWSDVIDGYSGVECGNWHLSGNYMEGTWAAKNGVNEDNYKAFLFNEYTSRVPTMTLDDFKSDYNTVPDEYKLKWDSPEDAFNKVLANVGAFPRDPVDTRVIQETKDGTATYYGQCGNTTNGEMVSSNKIGIIDKPSDVGGYPELKTYNEITDNDHDGMDDAWETANGFDPTDRDDRNTALKDGYTALEAYLCSLVGETISLERANPYDIVVAQDGSGDYKTINEAINAAPDNGERTLIFVRNGEYKEKVFIGHRYENSTKVLSIIGESKDGVIITWDDYLGKQIDYPTQGTITADGVTSPTMTITAPDFYMENVTVRNTVKENVAQAIALYQAGDRQILKNVNIEGYQDTHRTKKTCRMFLYDCVIKGNTDFIYGGGSAYFYKCNIVSRGYVSGQNGGYITAPEDVPYYGYLQNDKKLYYEFVFNDCDLTNEDGVQGVNLSRAWTDHDCGTVYMNCRYGSHISAEGWVLNGADPATISFAEYNNVNASDGTPVDVSKRPEWSIQMEKNDMPLLNLKTMYSAVNPNSEFSPAAAIVGVMPPTNVSSDATGTVTWTEVEGAKGYIVYLDGKIVGFAEGGVFFNSAKTAGTYTVRAVAENGAMSPMSGEEYRLTVDKLNVALNPYVKDGEVSEYECTFNLSCSPAEGGTVSASQIKAIIGDMVTITATPAEGYEFVNWTSANGRVYSTSATYTFEVEKSIDFTANFRRGELPLLHHVPVATDGYAYEFFDATLIPGKRPNAETNEDEWFINTEYTSWVRGTEAGIHVGTSRPVYIDPYTHAKLNSTTAISWGTGNEVRVYPEKPLLLYLAGIDKIMFFLNGGATPTGKLIANVLDQESGESQDYISKRNIGKSSSNPSDTLLINLDDSKKYLFTLSSKPLQKETTAEIAIWLMKMWPGDPSGIKDIELDALDENTPIFNLQGQRVATLRKGQIYIRKGKKFIAK